MFPYDHKKSSGILIHNNNTNQSFYDCRGISPLGHDFKTKLEDLEKYLYIPSDSDQIEQIREKLINQVKPKHVSNISFFYNREFALDYCLRLAIKYKIEKISRLGYRDMGQQVISFYGSNHAEAGLGINLSESSHQIGNLSYKWPKFQTPGKTEEEENLILNQILGYTRQNERFISAIILEPIQIRTGYKFSESFLHNLKDLCLEYNIRLIYDESSFPVGCFGSYFLSSSFKLKPDLILFGPSLGLAGVLLNDLSSLELQKTEDISYLSYLKTTEIIEHISSQNLFKKVSSLGIYFKKRIEIINEKYQRITNIFQKGATLEFEPISNLKNNLLLFSNNNILPFIINNRVWVFLPFTVQKDEINKLVSALETVISKI